MNWDTIKIVLGIFFLIGVFGLVPILIGLSVTKKKFLLYCDQIRQTGRIDKEIGFAKAQFDLFIAGYIFMDIPTASQRPDVYRVKQMTELKSSIETLTKIAKPLALFVGLISIISIILLNIFEK